MDHASMLRRLAERVQAELDATYRQHERLEPGSALDQAGLRDGFEIVVDYLDHNELGPAFEHLLYMISEPGLLLPRALLHDLAHVGGKLGFDERCWSAIGTAEAVERQRKQP